MNHRFLSHFHLPLMSNESLQESGNSQEKVDQTVPDNPESKQLIKRFSLDPKQIQALENEINQVMQLDHDQNIIASINRQSTTDIPFNMDIITIRQEIKKQEASQPKKSCISCCKKTQVSNLKQTGPTSEYSIMNNTEKLLPPLSDSSKITLVLDLDETLVHSSLNKVIDPDYVLTYEIGGDGDQKEEMKIYVRVRPFAQEFIETIGELYEIVIFSNMDKKYTDTIVDFLDRSKKIKYRLYKESLVDLNGAAVKDLSLLDRELSRIIIVDNNPFSYLLHPYNAIPIESWFKNKNDTELKTIMDFLIENHEVADVYSVLVQK